jgi:hypothetical protein
MLQGITIRLDTNLTTRIIIIRVIIQATIVTTVTTDMVLTALLIATHEYIRHLIRESTVNIMLGSIRINPIT